MLKGGRKHLVGFSRMFYVVVHEGCAYLGLHQVTV